jgi:hypothetical protein
MCVATVLSSFLIIQPSHPVCKLGVAVHLFTRMCGNSLFQASTFRKIPRQYVSNFVSNSMVTSLSGYEL